MNRIVDTIITFLINNNAIKTSDKEVYKYCIEYIGETLFYWFCIFFIGVVSDKFIDTIIFAIMFCILRSCAGGFHASTPRICFLISLAVYGIVVFGFPFIPIMNNRDIFIFILINYILILCMSPVDNVNKRLSHKKKYNVKLLFCS